MIVVLLVLVAGDEECVEAAAPRLDRCQAGEARVGEILLIRHEQRLAGLRDLGRLALVAVLLAGAWAGDSEGDQVHVPPACKVLADQLAEPLAEAVDRRRVERNLLLLLEP